MTYSNVCRVFLKKTLHFLSKNIIVFIAIFPFLLNAQEFSSKILSQDQDHIRIKYSFKQPRLHNTDGKTSAQYKKSFTATDINGIQLPVINEFVSLAGSKANIRVISKKQKSLKVSNYFVSSQAGNTAYKMADIKYMGLYRDVSVFSLTLMPAQYNKQSHELIWTEEMVLEINNQSKTLQKERYQPAKRLNKNQKKIFIKDTQLFEQQIPAAKVELSANSPVLSNYSHIYKIKIAKTGFYKITYDDLLDAEFPLDQVNPKYLTLINKGSGVPLYFKGAEDDRFDSADYFEFWAERNEKTFLKDYSDLYNDPFSDENVYWLVEGTKLGSRMVEESGGLVETNPARYIIPFRFNEKLHFEKDSRWERFGYNPEYLDDVSYKYDHWFWGNPIGAVSSQSFDFELAHPYGQGSNVFVTAMFRGRSIPNSNTNQISGHQLSLWLNDEKVGDILADAGWIGQKKAQLSNTTALSQSNLQHGNNTLRVNMDQEGVTDIILFNWFDIQYYRKYRAHNNILKFKLQDDLFGEDKIIQFQVDGFDIDGYDSRNNNIQLYKLGLSKIVNSRVDLFRDTENNFNSYRISFQDQVYDPHVEYLAIREDAKLKPKEISPYTPWKRDNQQQTLLDKDNSADLIIVTHANFNEQAQRLKNIKEQKGFTTEVVTVEQIYNTFNNGIKSPLAIKEFLKYAYFNWDQSKKLQYVILAGDASYDYKGILSNSNDLVPTIMFSSNGYGASPADIQYACISGDDLIPDIAIGRIPASTATEFVNYIDKIEEYENNTDFGVWRNKALFISGNDESDHEIHTQKPVFRNQNNRIINLKLSRNVFGNKLNVVQDAVLGSDDPDFGGNRDLLDYFDDGLAYINFFGHGGGLIWSDKNLLNLDGVDDLNNRGKYPFITSMTCFTGAFENPSREGLSEKLVMTAEKGAIAALASSSVGWTYNDFSIQWGLHDYLWQKGMTFGEAVDNMKIAYMANSIYYTEKFYQVTPGYYWNNTAPLWSSMVNQYNLLGDPTLELLKPNASLNVLISDETPDAGQTITVSVQSAQNSGVGYMQITDENNRKYLDELFALSSGQHSIDFTLPSLQEDSLIVGKRFKVKAYVDAGNSGAAGSSELVVEGALIKSIALFPDNPQVNQKVAFEIIAKGHAPIAHIELRNFRNENSAGLGQVTLVMSQVNDTLFRSLSDHPGFNAEGTYLYEVYIRDEAGNEQKYDLNKIIVNDSRPDLELLENSVSYAGSEQLLLSFRVKNNSDQVLDSVFVHSFIGTDSISFFSNYFSFNANESKRIYAPLLLDSMLQYRLFKIFVDPDNTISERSENNNNISKIIPTDHIYIDPDIGSSTDGIQNNTLTILQKWQFFIDKNNISVSTVVAFADSSVTENIKQSDQRDLTYLPFRDFSDSTAFYIEFKNPAVNVLTIITTYLDSSADLSKASFYKYDNLSGLWSKVESGNETVNIDGKISADINQSGLYAVFSSNDQQVPFIEITANGRPLRDNVLVKSNPSIAFLLQDENGINLKNSFSVFIDDQPIPVAELTFPDTLHSANSIAVQATPKLQEGTHTIDVYVADLNNNQSSIHRTFKVSAENRIIVYGNYPNPFENSTIISFYNDFDNNLSRLRTKIYSVSGHLVRSKNLDAPDGISDYDPTELNYQELVWDGTDDDGNEVANGVYFVVIEAEYIDFTNKKSKFKETLKVAKLK